MGVAQRCVPLSQDHALALILAILALVIDHEALSVTTSSLLSGMSQAASRGVFRFQWARSALILCRAGSDLGRLLTRERWNDDSVALGIRGGEGATHCGGAVWAWRGAGDVPGVDW